jgi:hypothetical protein
MHDRLANLLATSKKQTSRLKTQTPNIKFIYACGLIPLMGGLTIFFSWWAGKEFFAINLTELEGLGFLWILICPIIAIIGLFFCVYNLFKYKSKYSQRTLIGFGVILLNIPAVDWVLDKQSAIEKRVYIKFVNNSVSDSLAFEIYGTKFRKVLGTLDNNESIIAYYVPMALPGDDSVPVYDSLKLVVVTKQDKLVLQLPEFYPGECHKVFLNKNLKSISSW